MVALRRPTTFRTLNRFRPAVTQSYKRFGEAPFDSVARTHLVRARRAGGLLNLNDVALGRNHLHSGKPHLNPSQIPPNRVLVRTLPGKKKRRLTPVLDRYGYLRTIP